LTDTRSSVVLHPCLHSRILRASSQEPLFCRYCISLLTKTQKLQTGCFACVYKKLILMIKHVGLLIVSFEQSFDFPALTVCTWTGWSSSLVNFYLLFCVTKLVNYEKFVWLEINFSQGIYLSYLLLQISIPGRRVNKYRLISTDK